MRHMKGVLLLELVVAVTLMATGLLTALYAFSISATNAGMVEREATAIMLARAKMEEVLSERTFVEGEEEGHFGDDFPRYRWTSEIQLVQTTAQGLGTYELALTVLWTNRSRVQRFTLETKAARKMSP